MRSNFKKFKVQISQVHTGTYWYIPVRTGIDIRTLYFDDALAAFLRRRVSTARLTRTCSSCLALFLTAVSATERPPTRGLPRPNIQSQWLTSYTLLPRLPSALALSALPMGKADPLCLLNLCGIVAIRRSRVTSQKQGNQGHSAQHVGCRSYIEARDLGRVVEFEHFSILHRLIDGRSTQCVLVSPCLP